MKKLVIGTILLSAIVVALLYSFRRNRPSSIDRARGDVPNSTLLKVKATRDVGERDTRQATNELERLQSEILPIAEEFLKRIEALKPDGVVLPFSLPITTNALTKLRFAGGVSNTVCTFNIGGHTHFACHVVKRDGKEIKGVNSFVRSGRDEDGVPRSFVQLTGDTLANERYIKLFADTTHYPPRNLHEVAAVAQRALAALRPQDAALYPLSESWQEERAATVLPFYLFAFARKAQRNTDPSNLMRDEIMIGFKSTTDGLVLDFFEDNSIAFVGQKTKPR